VLIAPPSLLRCLFFFLFDSFSQFSAGNFRPYSPLFQTPPFNTLPVSSPPEPVFPLTCLIFFCRCLSVEGVTPPFLLRDFQHVQVHFSVPPPPHKHFMTTSCVAFWYGSHPPFTLGFFPPPAPWANIVTGPLTLRLSDGKESSRRIFRLLW